MITPTLLIIWMIIVALLIIETAIITALERHNMKLRKRVRALERLSEKLEKGEDFSNEFNAVMDLYKEEIKREKL